MSSGFVNWVESAQFFGRPHAWKRQTNLTCSQVATRFAYSSAFASCRDSAAGGCETPGPATWSGDSCICSSLYQYDSAFSDCIYNDTPYSDCIDPNNRASVSVWSKNHCTFKTTTPTPDPTTPTPDSTSTTTPTTPPTTTPTPHTDPDASTSSTSTSESSKETTSDSSSSESSSDPPTTTSEKSSTTPMSTPSSVPKPSLVPVTPASRVNAQSASATSSSASSTHSSLPRYTGSGNLLQGYCITPQYTLLAGPTAYWVPVIGCMGDRPDCCPFDVPISTSSIATGSVPPTITISVPQSGLPPTTTGNGGFPSALLPAQATLEKCPDDYFSISDACCPSNYFPWSTAFGGQTPCYSTLPTPTTPPPIPDSLIGTGPTDSAQSTPTSAIVNVVYAMQYPVKPSSKPALATNAKIGIGAGAGGAALVLGALVGLLIWKHRAHKRDKDTLKSLSGMGSTRQSVAASSAVGGVAEWRKNVPGSPTGGRFYEGLEPAPDAQPTLPNVGMTQAHYPADWRPGRRTISPPLPGTFVHHSTSTPSIPEGMSEADSQNAILNQRYSNNTSPMARSDGGLSSGNRSELYSGEYFPRQELQGVPEEQQWVQHSVNRYQNGAGEQWGGQQQTQYYEAPAGRMTPRVG